MTPRAVAVSWALAAMLVAGAADARRLPAPGGKLTVALPPDLVAPTTEAHLYVPMVEPVAGDDETARLARPALPGFPQWRSSVLRGLESSAEGKRWKLTTEAQGAAVAEALVRCFAKKTAGSWPAAALSARGVTVDVSSQAGEVSLVFSAPVGPLPDLLAGCPLRPNNAVNTGAYALVSPGVLAWKGGSLAPPPLLGVLELVGPTARADLVAFGADAPGTSTLLAPFPDVVLLVQSPAAKASDVLGLADKDRGLHGFLTLLRPDLLAAAYAQGRGAPLEGLLPPGVAPARPLPTSRGPERLLPLALVDLPADAPRLSVRRPEGDALVDGVVERLALLLRNRGTLVDLKRPGEKEPLTSGIEILRWRPPSTDPALALLALAGQRKELREDDNAKRALADPRLLSPAQEDRVAAALALERAWIESGVVVPLMAADRWFTVDPDLRGVVVRPDGVPLVEGAYFSGAYLGVNATLQGVPK